MSIPLSTKVVIPCKLEISVIYITVCKYREHFYYCLVSADACFCLCETIFRELLESTLPP
jgi:hypothetical protein